MDEDHSGDVHGDQVLSLEKKEKNKKLKAKV
jgi:hypothetical protein